jgi:hypothetical protein
MGRGHTCRDGLVRAVGIANRAGSARLHREAARDEGGFGSNFSLFGICSAKLSRPRARFDGSLGDVFELQDKVASSVAGVIEPALQAAETTRSANRPTLALDPFPRAAGLFLITDITRNRRGAASRHDLIVVE